MATDRREQKKLRRRRGERAFIFDKEVKHELGAVDREDWESAVVLHGGRVDAAAETCGLTGVPPDAKQFWGKSAEEARSNYVGWRRKRKKQVSQGPRHKRMNRPARLQSARTWLACYHGKNVIKGYGKHFAVDRECAVKELEMMGVPLDEDYIQRVRASTNQRGLK